MLTLLLPLSAQAAVVCVEDHYDSSATTDHDAIEAAIAAAGEGDTVLFGDNCSEISASATPRTYDIDESIDADHGLIYAGAGSTLRLVDRPSGDDWADWRGFRLLWFGAANTVTTSPTVLRDLTVDMNRYGQDAPTGDSAQYGVFFGGISAEEAADGHQQVTVEDVTCMDSSYQCLSFYNYIDGTLTDVETYRNHHGVSLNHSVSGSLDITRLEAGKDHTAVKVEGAATGTLSVTIHDSSLYSEEHALAWGVDCSQAASDCTLAVTASDLTNVSIWGKDHHASFLSSTITDIHGSDAYPAVSLWPRAGSSVSLSSTAVSGYLYLPLVDPDFGGLGLYSATFSGRGRDGYAIFTAPEIADERDIVLGKGTTFTPGAEMDRLLLLVGGTVTLDSGAQSLLSTDDVIVLNGSSAVQNVLIDADGETQYDSAVDGDDGRCAGDGAGGVSCWADGQ